MALTTKQQLMLFHSPLLAGCEQSVARNFVQTLTATNVLKGQTIASLPGKKAALGFVLEGSLDYMNLNGVLLATIFPGDFFEAQTLFTQVRPMLPFPIRAHTNSVIILIDRQSLVEAMHADSTFSRNYICILSDALQFITCRLGHFTAASPSVGLALYLLRFSAQNTFKLTDGFAGLARRLNISRATLYRALAELEQFDLVSHQEKVVHILNRDGLFQYAHLQSQLPPASPEHR